MYNGKGVFREKQVMLIDLIEILQKEEGTKKVQTKVEREKFLAAKFEYKITDSDVKFVFTNAGKKHINVKCTGNVIIEAPCFRCLEPVTFTINIDSTKDMDMNKTAEEKIAELDEDYYLEGTSFDTEVLIHNEVLVNLPMKVLCRENCKGICNRCGANLNLGSCKCDDAELDPRMSKILDIFNQFKEV
jgi:hypothetical protein